MWEAQPSRTGSYHGMRRPAPEQVERQEVQSLRKPKEFGSPWGTWREEHGSQTRFNQTNTFGRVKAVHIQSQAVVVAFPFRKAHCEAPVNARLQPHGCQKRSSQQSCIVFRTAKTSCDGRCCRTRGQKNHDESLASTSVYGEGDRFRAILHAMCCLVGLWVFFGLEAIETQWGQRCVMRLAWLWVLTGHGERLLDLLHVCCTVSVCGTLPTLPLSFT